MARRSAPHDDPAALRAEIHRLQAEVARRDQAIAELGASLASKSAEAERFRVVMLRERSRAETAESRVVPTAATMTESLSQRLVRKKYGARFDMPGSDAAAQAEVERILAKHRGGDR